MRKSEMFNAILDVVAAETEISQACMLSTCRQREVVDARHMLCYFLLRQGLTSPAVAKMLRCTPRNVEKIRDGFALRRKQGGRAFQFVFERIANTLRNAYELTD